MMAIRSPRRRSTAAILVMIGCCAALPAQDFNLGASFRGFGFYSGEDNPWLPRRDSELLVFRLTPEFSVKSTFKFETHLVMDLVSPPLAPTSGLVSSRTRTYLDLDHEVCGLEEVALSAYLDRLNAQFRASNFQLVIGRQAITWGVNYFWPALDLFAPFSASRVDRDYKPGVDAVRLIVPVGAYSEVQAIAAALGPSSVNDRALAALFRLNLGPVDVGWMGGEFHKDKVAGTFVSSNLAGAGVRGELSWTQSGDPLDQLRERGVFWRGSLGIDRQLLPTVSLILETAWNQYGAADPADYSALLVADRLGRGEINSLGRHHLGGSVNWRFHPLWSLNNTTLVNWDDSSVLWLPSLVWSAGNNWELLFGGQFGFGKELNFLGLPRSEYGAYPHTVFAAFKGYL